MTTTIRSNGSKWGGQAPDPVEKLFDRLTGPDILDPDFEEYGNFVYAEAGLTHFFGNFLTYSHVFNIDTDDPDLIERLTAAIRANQLRPEYQAEVDRRFTPVYEPWRHGGWYVTNVRHPSGGVGCVSRNFPDRKWRIVCDDRPGSYPGGPDDHTYPTRDAAARAERELVARAHLTGGTP